MHEGIGGYEEFRADLGLMYFPSVNHGPGNLVGLAKAATRIRNLLVNQASTEGASWLREALNRESEAFGVGIGLNEDYPSLSEWGQTKRRPNCSKLRFDLVSSA